MYNRTLQRGVISTLFLLSLGLSIPVYAAAEEETPKNQRIPMEDVQRFSNAISLIKKYYVKPVDDKELFDNAIRGMLSGLDPHSTFLDEEAFNELQTATTGEFGGLGLEVTMEDGVVKVITPLVDTPAFKAGMKAGDYIIKLGPTSVQGLSLKDAVAMMRGKEGSSITLTVLRKGESKPLTFTLVRQKILIKSVKGELLDNNYGYIRLSQFQATTADDMEKAIQRLKSKSKGDLKGLILDLRNNPGGLLDSAIQVSDAFITNDPKGKEELIVYTQGRLPGSHFTAVAKPGDVLNNAPMVVLINNGSASAAEIVAGALKDNKRAIIVGTKSFGKGSVHTVLPLDEKTAVKLTTALYFTPSGVSIQAKGITPDIVIEEVKVGKVDDQVDSYGFSEADLSGHLQNGNKQQPDVAEASKKDEPAVPAQLSAHPTDDSLLHQDYQLYTALTILKGLAVAKR